MIKKRLTALLLAALLLFTGLPAVHAETPAEPAEESAVWAQIEALENEAILAKRSVTGAEEAVPTEEDFAAIVDDVIALVEASPDYAEGTVERHGDFFFWESKDGTANGYSPRMRAKMRQSAIEGADPETFSGIETVSYASRAAGNCAVDVAVFQPYFGLDADFKETYAEEGARIAWSTGGESQTYRANSATIDEIAAALERCGVVIFDSHGETDYFGANKDYTSRANSSYICLQTNKGITSKDQEPVSGTYGTYYHAYYLGNNGEMQVYCVDGTAIANHMKNPAKHSLVWSATCLSMATDGLARPLHNKGVEVVYGYSQSVSFKGDYIFEGYFFDHLISGYSVGKSISYMKSKAGCSFDPAYSAYSLSTAKQYRVAFPIVVSSEDKYPGKGKVDGVQKPKSGWKLRNAGQICENCPGSAFWDMPAKDEWSHVPIEWAIENRITNGVSNTSFGTEVGCTRAQVATFLWRAAGCPDPVRNASEESVDPALRSSPFTDIAASDYFYTAVLWAVSMDITQGTGNGKFSPNATCTRGQIVTFLWRFGGKKEPASSYNPFTDVKKSDYFYTAVLWASENDITSGTSATKFSPKNTCTRAQVVTFLYRYIQLFTEE